VTPELAGGQGTAVRPRGVLGAGATTGQRLDRHLPEIAALIDPRQFELIAAPASGVVAIQGGAGSGKTTIGLHRIAYLAYAAPSRFPPRRILVVTHGSALAAYIAQVLPALGVPGVRALTFRQWAERELERAIPWLRARLADDTPPLVARVKDHPALLGELERRARAHRGKRGSRAVLELWADLLTDRRCLVALLAADLGEAAVVEAHRAITERAAAVLDREPAEARDEPEAPPDEEERGATGVDGLRTDDDRAVLDVEDAAMLMRVHQIVRGTKRPLAHLFVDEAQDLSPMKLASLIGQTGPHPSVTLAGDTAQRLFLDNGFSDWRAVLQQLSLAHVAIEPLRLSYRSTRQILGFARAVMGGLAGAEPPEAPRSGAPVEAHRFPGTGAAVAFCAEALRGLLAREPRATVAVLARHPEQADRWFEGLRRAEVPMLRRVRSQDFAFRPGVEVTDVRQVKGLEFDYVLLVDVNDGTWGRDDESRHLLHIGATRAAHQLWLIVTATPSPLVPGDLLAY
jgi:DNA helicase-2/ATP-dependent DNA helicase PcrA